MLLVKEYPQKSSQIENPHNLCHPDFCQQLGPKRRSGIHSNFWKQSPYWEGERDRSHKQILMKCSLEIENISETVIYSIATIPLNLEGTIRRR